MGGLRYNMGWISSSEMCAVIFFNTGDMEIPGIDYELYVRSWRHQTLPSRFEFIPSIFLRNTQNKKRDWFYLVASFTYVQIDDTG